MTKVRSEAATRQSQTRPVKTFVPAEAVTNGAVDDLGEGSWFTVLGAMAAREAARVR